MHDVMLHTSLMNDGHMLGEGRGDIFCKTQLGMELINARCSTSQAMNVTIQSLLSMLSGAMLSNSVSSFLRKLQEDH